MGLGISYAGDYPLSDFLKVVQAGEQMGFEAVWLAEEFTHTDPMVTAASVLAATRRVQVMPGPVSPYLKHPVIIAREALSLAANAGDRLGLQLGTGDLGGLKRLGVRVSHPLATMAAALRIIKALCRGETIFTNNDIWNLDGIVMRSPSKHDIPLYLAAMGPRMLSLAGAEADGIVLSHMMSVGFTHKSLSVVNDSSGSQTAVRPKIVQFIAASVAENRKTAYDQIRPSVVRWLSAPYPQPAHVEDWKFSNLDIDHLAIHRALQRGDDEAASRLVSDDAIAILTASGTPADFERRAREYIEAGVDQPIIGPVGNQDAKLRTIRLAGQMFSPAH